MARRVAGRLGSGRLRGGDAELPLSNLRDLAEDPLLQVDRDEERVAPKKHLGLAQEQVALFTQGVMEAGPDARLGLGLEIHQGVAADQQVDAGDWRVLYQVVASEDDRAA